MMTGTIWAFLGVALLVLVTPGPDTALTVRNTLLGGRAAGILTVAGINAGQAIWALATSAGVVALLLASELMFHAVRLAGAAYLVLLGVQSLIAAWRGHADDLAARPAAARLAPRAAFRQGLISNLSNPKMAAFFGSLLPQFAPSTDAFATMLLLGLAFIALTGTWLTIYTLAVARAGDVLRRPRVRRAIEGATGAVLVAFGLRLASER